MQFYLVHTQQPALEATQAEAKEAAKRQCPRPAEWAGYELDTTKKPVLLAQVQELMAMSYKAGQASRPAAQVTETVTPEPAPVPAADPTPRYMAAAGVPQISPQAIEEWVLDQATVAQCEQLFARLGTRFAELREKA